jgi:hypothetical protein
MGTGLGCIVGLTMTGVLSSQVGYRKQVRVS